MAYTLKSGSENKYLEEKFVTWDEVGLVGPDQSPSKIFSMGRNGTGQLGLGDTTPRSSPVQIGSLTNWKLVESGLYVSYAIKTDGTLWKSGADQISTTSSPVQVGTLTNWKQVSAGDGYTTAIKTDGTLWVWGSDFYSMGKLGLGNFTTVSSPVQIGSLSNWKQISNKTEYSLAIKTDGTLWAWGYGSYATLGLGNTSNYSSPVQVGSLTNWKQVDTGGLSGSAAIKTDGTLWTWGTNSFGVLGQNNATNYSSPVQVGSLTDWKQVSIRNYNTAAIKNDGTLWIWGQGTYGQLGLGDRIHRSSPVQVGSLTNWKQVITGQTTIAVKTDGTLWTWGYNAYGQLGLGDRIHRSSPVQVGSLTRWKSVSGTAYSTNMSQYNY